MDLCHSSQQIDAPTQPTQCKMPNLHARRRLFRLLGFVALLLICASVNLASAYSGKNRSTSGYFFQETLASTPVIVFDGTATIIPTADLTVSMPQATDVESTKAAAQMQVASLSGTLQTVQQQSLAQQQMIRALKLSTYALNELSQDLPNPERSTLLAIRSLQQSYTPIADMTLMRATFKLNTKRLFTHSGTVLCVAFFARQSLCPDR